MNTLKGDKRKRLDFTGNVKTLFFDYSVFEE